MSASYPELTALRRPSAGYADLPTAINQTAAPAPVGGPAPAGHSHRPDPTGDRHPHYRWLLIPRELRAPADHRMPARRPVDAVTAVIPTVQHASTEGPTA